MHPQQIAADTSSRRMFSMVAFRSAKERNVHGRGLAQSERRPFPQTALVFQRVGRIKDAAVPELRETQAILVQREHQCIKLSSRPMLRQWKRLLGPAYRKSQHQNWRVELDSLEQM